MAGPDHFVNHILESLKSLTISSLEYHLLSGRNKSMVHSMTSMMEVVFMKLQNEGVLSFTKFLSRQNRLQFQGYPGGYRLMLELQTGVTYEEIHDKVRDSVLPMDRILNFQWASFQNPV